MNFGMYSALLRAFSPLFGSALIAGGIKISPELLALVTDNLATILISIGTLAAAFPSLKAAVKYKELAE